MHGQQPATRAGRRGEHAIALLDGAAERLLAHDVAAALERGAGQRLVRVRRREHGDAGRAVVAQQLVEIGVDARDAVALRLLTGALRVEVEDARDLERLGQPGGREVRGRAAARSDRRDSQWGHHL